ncbi:hypothetical protein SUGI_0409390 [Cryptomeria japonica]|nr:hypothetical protein SUGI_0409390 [Cryptomeria japonica]
MKAFGRLEGDSDARSIGWKGFRCSKLEFSSQMDFDPAKQGDLGTAESLEKVGRAFKKVQRSYHSTPNGWRLATYEEAKNGLGTIKKKNLLKRWDRVRLLDGWMTGLGYNYEMGNNFKGCLGCMLLIQTEISGTLSFFKTKFL